MKMSMLMLTEIGKMKTFVIEEKFVGYADITIEAETEEEALALYNRGHYLDSNYNIDDMFYDCLLYTSPSPRDAHESRMPSSD